jgi:hypothetical protein
MVYRICATAIPAHTTGYSQQNEYLSHIDRRPGRIHFHIFGQRSNFLDAVLCALLIRGATER